MAEAVTDTSSVERVEDFGQDPAAIAQRWISEITLAKKSRDRWGKQCRKILKRYKDERGERDVATRFNILWANVQTLGPAIYAKVPQVIVQRRYLDRDPIGRIASRVLERVVAFQMDVNDFHSAFKLSRDDYLLTAQGVAWIRYEPTYKEATDQLTETQNEDITARTQPEVVDENTIVDYVHWQDYLCSPARVEDEVSWKARRVFLTRKQLIKRFGEIGKQVSLDHTPANMSEEDARRPENELLLKATVWEIWDREERQIIFIAEKHNSAPLQIAEDPLNLKGFWPTPRPCVATTTTDSIVPIPDYVQYRDQAQELDDLTNRISLLTAAIKAAGVYDSSWPELQRLLEEGTENQLYPVDQWSAFAERGGIPGAVSFLPIKEMAEVLIRLYEARQQVKNDLYEVTGISDIIRGFSSGATKTATEQRIKGQFANLRLSDRQAELARFTRDAIAIVAELIAEHFSRDTIYLMSGYAEWGVEEHMPPEPVQQPQAQQGMEQTGGPTPPQSTQNTGPALVAVNGQQLQQSPQALHALKMEEAKRKADAQFDEALKLLRNEKLRGFRVDIETDSTIEPNLELEKQTRTEFLSAASQFQGQALELGMAVPTLIPLLGKMLMFGVRGFRAGRGLETSFEEAIADLEKQAANPSPQPPGPDEIRAQTEKARSEAAIARVQMEQKARAEELQAETTRQQLEIQQRVQEADRDAELRHQERQMQLAEQALQHQIREQEHLMRMKELQHKAELEAAQHERAMQKLQLEAQAAERKAKHDEASDDRKAEIAQ